MKIKRADIERILILCAAALVVVLALRSNDQTTSQVLVEQTAIPIEQTIAQEDTVATVVFYEDGDGYLVPVTRQVPKTDGIAKATLALMVKDAENDMQAARLGLRTVIPEGTTFDIDISEGRANVNVSKEALNCIDARQESLMVDAITNALTCFSTVDEVTLEFDGQKRSKLTYGTDVSGVFTGGNLNLEYYMKLDRSENGYVSKLLEAIRTRYGEKLSIESISEEMGVSASYLSRKFKEITGQTFLDFLNKYRVQQAITLLNTKEYRISEISEAVGFSDYKHFCSVFKKYTLKSPTKFVKGG